MNPHHKVTSPYTGEQVVVARSPSISSLQCYGQGNISDSTNQRSRRSKLHSSFDHSECHSENSQVLYMARGSKRSRRSRTSLSSIGNQATRILDGSSDTKDVVEEQSDLDEFAWHVIDREIFEWRYICRTGRPYWWSPESKYSRLKKLPTRLFNEPPPQSWMQGVHTRPKSLYNKQRRAASDGCIRDQNCVDDIAYLVAIQLLSSCYTLHPDQIGLPSSEFNCYNPRESLNPPEAHMISSLRMHTHFRFTPSFGHQARNSSPVQFWSGSYDGPSPTSSPPGPINGLQNPIMGASASTSRRRTAHRPLNTKESAEKSFCTESQLGKYSEAADLRNLGCPGSMRTGSRQLETDDSETRLAAAYRPFGKDRNRTHHANYTWNEEGMSISGVQTSSRPRSPTTNYRLQPVIRSEPHHVFVQPVKELVVKRWKTFRRRFGGSLHSPLPTDSTEFKSQLASPPPSENPSPTMSSDARTRRLRAQERGDIHSSVDSTPHCNTPASGCGTPGVKETHSPYWIDSVSPSPNFQLADPLAAAAALAMAEVEIPLAPSFSTPPDTSKPSENHIQLGDCPAAIASHSTPELRSQPRDIPSNPSQLYNKRLQRRQNRKSTLSEMHTPEDMAENHALNEANREPWYEGATNEVRSMLASPKEDTEEPELDTSLELRSGARESIGNLGPVGDFSLRRLSISSEIMRLRLSKTSTSGTQIFTPSEEGFEIDGLPVGPSKDVWGAETDSRRERTYL